MARQLTLFKKEKEEVKEEITEEKQIVEEEKVIVNTTDKAVREHCEFIDYCEKNKIRFKAVLIDTICYSNLNEGIRYELKTTSQTQNSWGSGGNYETAEEILREKETICEDYFVDSPTTEKGKTFWWDRDDGYFWVGGIKAENVRLFITEKAKEILEKRGINVKEVIKKWGNMKNKLPTKENLKDFKEIQSIGEKLSKMGYCRYSSDDNEVRKIKKSIRAKLGMNESYENKKEVCPVEYSNMGLDELHKKLLKLHKEAKELAKKGDFLLNKYYYSDNYFTREVEYETERF